MDISQLTSSSQSNSAVQGVQGHHHHHKKSIADMIKDLQSAIDDATKSGALTSDQATALTKDLNDIKNTLSQLQTSSNGSTSATGTATQLSSDDRDKIRKDLRDIGKQLFAAFGSQSNSSSASSTSSAQQTNRIDDLFKAIDSDNDGTISKGELSSYLRVQASNAPNNTNGLYAGSFTYSEQATFSISETQSSFSVTA
jgi:septal ring factor EnvC (AmiA/AmiB activator)